VAQRVKRGKRQRDGVYAASVFTQLILNGLVHPCIINPEYGLQGALDLAQEATASRQQRELTVQGVLAAAREVSECRQLRELIVQVALAAAQEVVASRRPRGSAALEEWGAATEHRQPRDSIAPEAAEEEVAASRQPG